MGRMFANTSHTRFAITPSSEDLLNFNDILILLLFFRKQYANTIQFYVSTVFAVPIINKRRVTQFTTINSR